MYSIKAILFGGNMTAEKILINMRKSAKTPVSFRINEYLIDRFREDAERKGMSQAQYIEQLIIAGILSACGKKKFKPEWEVVEKWLI